jgi:hypothetical protein
MSVLTAPRPLPERYSVPLGELLNFAHRRRAADFFATLSARIGGRFLSDAPE